MKTRSLILYSLIYGVSMTWSWQGASAQNQSAPPVISKGSNLVMGRITASPKKHFSALNGVVKYVSETMSNNRQLTGEVLVAKNYRQMASYLRSGAVHFISETPFAAIRLADDIRAEILVGELKKGVENYQTYFFSRTDSGITSIDNLSGKKIAFEDPGSTSAFLVPLAILKKRNYQVSYLSNPRGNVPPGTVGYSFAEGEINIVSWVALKVTDVGTVSNLDWQELQRTPERIKQDLQIIHKGPLVLRSVIVVSPKMPETTKLKLKATLLDMHNNEKGKAALKPYKVSRFKALTDDAVTSLDRTREMLSLIRDEIE